MKKYKIIAIIGESGAGKDTLLKAMLKAYPFYHEIISCTTRPPREGEEDGINYHFLTEAEFFDERIADNVLESCWFNNWQYGTLKTALSAEQVNIGVFNPEGVRSLLKRQDVDLKVFWVQVPGKERLIRQLNREENPNIKEILRRYSTDELDFSTIDFEYIVVPNYGATDLLIASSAINCTVTRADWLKGKKD